MTDPGELGATGIQVALAASAAVIAQLILGKFAIRDRGPMPLRGGILLLAGAAVFIGALAVLWEGPFTYEKESPLLLIAVAIAPFIVGSMTLALALALVGAVARTSPTSNAVRLTMFGLLGCLAGAWPIFLGQTYFSGDIVPFDQYCLAAGAIGAAAAVMGRAS